MSAPDPGLHLHKFPPTELEGWKSYPVRIRGPRPSPCHDAPTLLVQSMKGGFVSANCSVCGGKDVLKQHEFLSLFLWVSCPICRAQMNPELLSRLGATGYLAANYGYACFGCVIYILLADILPHWEDLVLPG